MEDLEQPRKAEDKEALKKKPLDHEEDTFHADLNAFGNGHTTLEEVKKNWKHLE